MYFLGLTLISYWGNFGGGKGILSFGPDFLALGILSAVVLYLAVRFRASDALVMEKCQALLLSSKSEHELTLKEVLPPKGCEA